MCQCLTFSLDSEFLFYLVCVLSFFTTLVKTEFFLIFLFLLFMLGYDETEMEKKFFYF